MARMKTQKLFIPGDKYQANNQRAAVDYLVDTISAKRYTPGQDTVIQYARGTRADKRRRDKEGIFFVMVCAETKTAPANWPAVDGEYTRHFFKLFCAGIKIVRQMNDGTGRIAIYTIDKATWLQVIQKSITHGVNSLEWDQIRKLCILPPVVSHPFARPDPGQAIQKTAYA